MCYTQLDGLSYFILNVALFIYFNVALSSFIISDTGLFAYCLPNWKKKRRGHSELIHFCMYLFIYFCHAEKKTKNLLMMLRSNSVHSTHLAGKQQREESSDQGALAQRRPAAAPWSSSHPGRAFR